MQVHELKWKELYMDSEYRFLTTGHIKIAYYGPAGLSYDSKRKVYHMFFNTDILLMLDPIELQCWMHANPRWKLWLRYFAFVLRMGRR